MAGVAGHADHEGGRGGRVSEGNLVRLTGSGRHSDAIVDKLNHAVNESLKSAEVRASLAKLGMEAKIGTAQDFASALAEQVRDWKSVVEATGIKVD